MTQYRPYLLIIPLILLLSIGCSSGSNSPTTPIDNLSGIELPVVNEKESSNSFLAGFYTIDIDLDTLDFEIESNRLSMAHFNVTSFLPPPGITINSFNPVTGIVDVDVLVNNDTTFNAYDLRFIVYTTNLGHKLVNADSWTDLFDIAGGLPINPFKAYNKDIANRPFPGKSNSTENLLIYLPGGNPQVSFAIEASFPGNCEEPYEILNFSQHGVLYNHAGASARLTVDVKDHQDDVAAVQVFCPVITGSQLVPFSHEGGLTWGIDLLNNTGAGEGQYTAYLLATSSGQSLYNEVTVTVTKQQSGLEPVGDVSVTSINRGEGGANAMRITSVDFDWEDSQGAVEYAIERKEAWLDTEWTVIGTSSTSSFNFVPTGNDLDHSYLFRVIARAEAGGNPNTDASPSYQVFILFMSDAGYTSGHTWSRNKEVEDSGLFFAPWWGGGDEWGPAGGGMEGVLGIPEQPNTNIWAITHTPYPIPNLEGAKEAFADGWMFRGYNWTPQTLGWTIGTLSAPEPTGSTVCDYNPSNQIYDDSYWGYNRQNIQGQNQEFCLTNQAGWAGLNNSTWVQVGYYLNDLLEPDRNYIAMGLANGSDPLPSGS